MRIIVNGNTRTVADDTALRDLLPPEPRGSAVAVNAEVVPRHRIDECRLADGDRVEIVTAVQGG